MIPQPSHLIVTSAMRTGSTWLYNLLVKISGAKNHYVTSAVDAQRLIQATPNGIIKTHAVIDIDWKNLPAHVPIVRIFRNYKDSLVSRALYTKNIRPSAGEPINEPAMRELLAGLGKVTDEQFVAAFIDQSELVKLWLAEIAVMERGESDRCLTVMYEAMMYNPFQMMEELVAAIWPQWESGLNLVESVVRTSLHEGLKQRRQYLRKQAVGVGGWEAWLTAEQSDRLDVMYRELKQLALKHPELRWGELVKRI